MASCKVPVTCFISAWVNERQVVIRYSHKMMVLMIVAEVVIVYDCRVCVD